MPLLFKVLRFIFFVVFCLVDDKTGEEISLASTKGAICRVNFCIDTCLKVLAKTILNINRYYPGNSVQLHLAHVGPIAGHIVT